MSESRFFSISPSGKLARHAYFEEAIAATREGGFLWLDFFRPGREALSAHIESLGIHPLSIEDCTDENQVPKIEDFPRNTFVIFNAYSYCEGSLKVDEVDLFLGQEYLVTVSGYGSEDRRPLDGIERIVELNIGNASLGPAFLMHLVLDYIVDRKFIAIEALEDELTTTEESMLASPSGFNPAELLGLRRSLLALRKSLFHEREILVKICRRDSPFIVEKAIYHFRDIYDHLSKFFELTEAYREIVTSLMELHMSMLNNLMAKTANEKNSTVRRLTFITTIFMPLTLLAGVFGMSEWSMMTGPPNWRIAYPAFLLAMAMIGVANYYLLKHLGKRDRGAGGSGRDE